MKTIYSTLAATLMLGLAATSALGQERGDVIHGTVSDEFGPLPMAHVLEINKDGRVTASGVTDVNGNFSFAIRSPQDKLKITYVGCETKIIPIKGTTYKIMMAAQQKSLKEVTVTAQRKTVNSGLAIPETEMSIAAQTISAKEFEGLPVTSIDEALQGRIASLDIVATSGNLGAGSSMRLRGVSTINGNAEPLIVVDGNVFEADTKSFDFSSANDEKFAELLSVNPDDIEAISVLKDAAATSIWGSQGANGVIEIKTKRGARGKTRVTYSYRANMTYQPQGINLLTGGEYQMYLKEAYFNPRLSDDAAAIKEISSLHSDAEFAEWRQFDNNTDWRDAVTQIGLEQKHFFSLTGGGDKANFRVSAGYDHQTGSIIAQQLDRFTTRTALDFMISRSIKVTANFNFTYTNNQKNNEKAGSLLSIAQTKMPNLGIYVEDANGVPTDEYYHIKSTASTEFNNDQKKLPNPVALAHEATNNEKTFNIQPEFILSYDLLGTEADEQRLKYEGKVNFSIFNRFSNSFYPSSLVTENWSDKKNNNAIAESSQSFAITTTHTLTYQPVFKNRDHNLMAMARFQSTMGSSRNQGKGIYGLPTGIVSSSADGIIDEPFTTGAGQSRSVYLTGQLHYSYKSRYSLTFSVRRDGSTKFGKDSRWGTFPGISGRWNISDESWMKWSKKYLSMLSIRPSWGIVGNQPWADNLYFAKYAQGPSYLGHTSIYPSNIALNTLRWEQKEQWNLGFDLGFLDNRLSADVNLYKSRTTDLLMSKFLIPSNSGFPSLSNKNAGVMTNVGWEFNINARNLLHWGKWNIDLNVTFANNHNELEAMDESLLYNLNKEFDRVNGSYLSRVQLNNAFGSIYGFRYKGVYQYTTYSDAEIPGVSGPNAPVARNAAGDVIRDENGYTKPVYFDYDRERGINYMFKGGDAIYEDINHDGNINELDIVYLGSSLPKLTGGFGITITWGNLSWNNQFNFRYGNKIINRARMDLESMYTNNNQSRAVNWRWRVEGDLTEIPRALHNYGYNWLGSDRFVEDGSFLRLNYSSLNYNFESKRLRPLGISSLKVFLTAQNLFCLTKYSGADPEVNYGGMGVVYDSAKTPRAKSFSAGASIMF